MTILETIQKSEIYLLSIPLVVSLAFGSAFIEELHSRFVLLNLVRCGKNPYLISKTITAAISGGMVVVSAWFLFLPSSYLAIEVMKPQLVETMLFTIKDLLQMGGWVLFAFGNGCIWALVGAISAAVMGNKYMAYAAPFIFYYILSSFQKRYYVNLPLLNPQEWASPTNLELWQSAVLIVVLIFLIATGYIAVMKWRLKYV